MKKHSNDRIKEVAEFTRKYLKTTAEENGYSEVDYMHRWQHSLRVANYGKEIAIAENADVEVVTVACLLHDVCKFSAKKGENHGWKAAKVSRKLLIKLEYSDKQINNISYAIASHVNGNAGFNHPHTLEGRVTWDADLIDKNGTFRIVNKTICNSKQLKKSIKKLREKIKKVSDRIKSGNIQTETGERIIKIQLKKQLNLYKYLLNEKKMSKIPKI